MIEAWFWSAIFWAATPPLRWLIDRGDWRTSRANRLWLWIAARAYDADERRAETTCRG